MSNALWWDHYYINIITIISQTELACITQTLPKIQADPVRCHIFFCFLFPNVTAGYCDVLEDRGLSKHIKTHCLPAGPSLVQSGLSRKKFKERYFFNSSTLILQMDWTGNPLPIYGDFIKLENCFLLSFRCTGAWIEFKFLSYFGWCIGTF